MYDFMGSVCFGQGKRRAAGRLSLCPTLLWASILVFRILSRLLLSPGQVPCNPSFCNACSPCRATGVPAEVYSPIPRPSRAINLYWFPENYSFFPSCSYCWVGSDWSFLHNIALPSASGSVAAALARIQLQPCPSLLVANHYADLEYTDYLTVSKMEIVGVFR